VGESYTIEDERRSVCRAKGSRGPRLKNRVRAGRLGGGRRPAAEPTHPTEAPTISAERCLETYLVEINEVPLLTAEEERELGRRIQAGDLQAAGKMIRANLRLVVSVAKTYADAGSRSRTSSPRATSA
jgi:DNA-directed RNA polymerase sigma subunit (sigma70/sigma32)